MQLITSNYIITIHRSSPSGHCFLRPLWVRMAASPPERSTGYGGFGGRTHGTIGAWKSLRLDSGRVQPTGGLWRLYISIQK